MLQTSTVILVPFSDSSEPAIPSQHFLKYTNNPNSCQCTVLSRWLHILLPKLTAFTSSSCAETRRDCRCENLKVRSHQFFSSSFYVSSIVNGMGMNRNIAGCTKSGLKFKIGNSRFPYMCMLNCVGKTCHRGR